MKYIYPIRNNPQGVVSIFNSMSIDDKFKALIEIVNDIKDLDNNDDEFKYRLSGDLVNENVEKFLLNYKEMLDCIHDNYVDDKNELLTKCIKEFNK